MKKIFLCSFLCILTVILCACGKQIGYKIKNGKIYLDGEIVISNKVNIEGDIYYTDAKGIIIKNQWVKDEYYDDKGKMVKDTFYSINGKEYAFDNDGKFVQNEMRKINGKSYFFHDTQVLKDGKYRIGNVSYKEETPGGFTVKKDYVLCFDGEEVELPDGFQIVTALSNCTAESGNWWNKEREFIIENKKVIYNSANEARSRYFVCSNGDRYYLDDNGKMIKCRYRDLIESDLLGFGRVYMKIISGIRNGTSYTTSQMEPLLEDVVSQYMDIESMNFNVIVGDNIVFFAGENKKCDNIELKKTFNVQIPLQLWNDKSENPKGIESIYIEIKKVNNIVGKYYMLPGELTPVEKKEKEIKENIEKAKSYKTINVYDEFVTIDEMDSIKIGKYYDMAYGKPNNKFDLEWIVLDKNEEELMLLSKYTFTYNGPFGDYEMDHDEQYKNTEIPWEKTNIRQFLNGKFYNEAFSEEEKQKIITKEDRVSLLSSEQYYKYFSNKEKGKTRPYRYDKYDATFDSFNLKDNLTPINRNISTPYEHEGKQVSMGEVEEAGIYLGNVDCRPVIYYKIK